MGESTKQNSFHIRLLTLPDHMLVINNMDVKMRIPLPSMASGKINFHINVAGRSH